MKDVEEYLDSVCRDLNAPASLRHHLREELRSHIEEAIELHQVNGLPPEEATRLAVEEFGDPAAMRAELQGVYGRRLVSLMIDRAMEWKVKTMTTEWKWNFTGQFAVLMVIVVQLILIAGIAVFVLPAAVEHYSDARINVPGYLVSIVNVLRFFDLTWYIWLAFMVIGVFLFEWCGPKSGKATIRLGACSSFAFVLTIAGFAVTAGAMVPMTQATRELQQTNPEPAIFRAVEASGTLYAQLISEVEAKDLDTSLETARSLREELRFLSRTSSAAPILAGFEHRENIEEIRRLLTLGEELSAEIVDDARDAQQSSLTKHLKDLKAAYDGLSAIIKGWPVSPADQAEEA